MGASLMQAPLPWLPEGAAEVTRGVGIVAGEDGSGQVWVHGMMTFCSDAGDEASRRLAMVQLTVHLRAASMRQAADALGIESSTISRWAASYARQGLAGLVPEGPGAEGPVQADGEAGVQDPRAASGGEVAGGDLRVVRGVGVFRAVRAGPGPGAPRGDREAGRGRPRRRLARRRQPRAVSSSSALVPVSGKARAADSSAGMSPSSSSPLRSATQSPVTFLLVREGQVAAAVAAWRLTQSSMASWLMGVPRRVGNRGLPGPPGGCRRT